MTAILDQKSEFIKSINISAGESSKLFTNFIERFYKHASMGYLLSIAEQSSKSVLKTIAQLAFEIFKTPPLSNDFRISHHFLEESGLQVLLLHCHDKQFVVRSLGVWLAANKLDVKEFVHAIFKPQRTDFGDVTDCFAGN